MSSGHSTLVLILRTDDADCTSSPSPQSLQAQESVWTTSLLLAIQHEFCGDFFFLFAVFLPLWFQSPHWCQLWEGFLLHGNFFSFTTPSPGQLSILILNPLSLFLSLSFVLPHFEKIGLPFWASGVLCQCSVIFWKLLYIQMNFWCIFGGWGGESDLPILFLLHLGSALEEISYA